MWLNSEPYKASDCFNCMDEVLKSCIFPPFLLFLSQLLWDMEGFIQERYTRERSDKPEEHSEKKMNGAKINRFLLH